MSAALPLCAAAFAAIFAVVFGVAFAILVLTIDRAWSHDAPPSTAQPLGWTYGWECCSATDCKQSKQIDVSITARGYRINHTGEIIAYADPRIHKSLDEFYHRCTHGGDDNDPRSICLYVPQGAY